MPTKVLDLDIGDLGEDVENLTGYDAAFVLLRLNGLPLAKLRIPLTGPRLTREQVFDAAGELAIHPVADAWLDAWLGCLPRLSKAPLPSATVAVCTRDRPDDLARCLQSLVALRHDDYQVLVVDSCTNGDATRQVAAQFPQVRYVREEQPGLDRARNRALRESGAEVVAFIDDDAIADPCWLGALLSNFDDPEVMCVTGLTMPLELETEAQETFEKVYPFARGFTRQVYDRWAVPPAGAGRVGAGANMALRRSVLAEVSPFDEALDAGTSTLSGGDTDMFARILSRGYRIVYDPAALNWHRHRRTSAELMAQAFGYGAGVYAALTALWLREHDLAVFSLALNWLFRDQLPRLVRSLLKRRESPPPALLLAELRGCPVGVRAYLAERRSRAGGFTL